MFLTFSVISKCQWFRRVKGFLYGCCYRKWISWFTMLFSWARGKVMRMGVTTRRIVRHLDWCKVMLYHQKSVINIITQKSNQGPLVHNIYTYYSCFIDMTTEQSNLTLIPMENVDYPLKRSNLIMQGNGDVLSHIKMKPETPS